MYISSFTHTPTSGPPSMSSSPPFRPLPLPRPLPRRPFACPSERFFHSGNSRFQRRVDRFRSGGSMVTTAMMRTFSISSRRLFNRCCSSRAVRSMLRREAVGKAFEQGALCDRGPTPTA